MPHPTARTATRTPAVWAPEPKVRSQGTKILMLIMGGRARRKTIPAMVQVALSPAQASVVGQSGHQDLEGRNAGEKGCPARETKKIVPKIRPPGI